MPRDFDAPSPPEAQSLPEVAEALKPELEERMRQLEEDTDPFVRMFFKMTPNQMGVAIGTMLGALDAGVVGTELKGSILPSFNRMLDLLQVHEHYYKRMQVTLRVTEKLLVDAKKEHDVMLVKLKAANDTNARLSLEIDAARKKARDLTKDVRRAQLSESKVLSAEKEKLERIQGAVGQTRERMLRAVEEEKRIVKRQSTTIEQLKKERERLEHERLDLFLDVTAARRDIARKQEALMPLLWRSLV